MKNFVIYLSILVVFVADNQLFGQEIKNTKSDPNIPIFEIKNDIGQTVFAVYPGGVKVFIDDQLKAAGGGFTVGRLGTGKATGDDFFTVNPGDVKVIIPETGLKTAGGGFTVGRLGTGKSAGDTIDFLRVTPDSTRIFVNDSIAGFGMSSKGNGASERLLNLNKQNYFIGHNTGTNITTGKYNSVFGYEAGKSISTGDNNLFLGFQTGYLTSSGNDNIYIGNRTGYSRTGGYDNICIGNLAGENSPFATHSTFIGSEAGKNLAGDDNICIGDRAGTNAYIEYHEAYGTTIVGIDAGRNVIGNNNTFFGTGAGSNWSGSASGSNNVFIGSSAGGGGGLNKLGDNNVCIGYNAGFSKEGSNKLYISNSDTESPLIYGEFDTKNVIVTGNLYATGELASTSDINLKTNLLQIISGVELIKDMKAYYFDWNSEAINKYAYPTKKQIGLIAQEVEQYIPEIVSTSPNGFKAIDYTKLAPVLIVAVNEQQNTIEVLQKKVEHLEKSNEDLKQRVSELENLKSELSEMQGIINNLKIQMDSANQNARN